MSKQQYTWLLALAVIAARGEPADDQEDPEPLLQSVYARAGTFSNTPAASANDLTAAQQALLFIYLWNCAKYLAFLGVLAQNRAIFFQSNAAPFFSPHPAESRYSTGFRLIPSYPGILPALCQMNTPLTRVAGD